MDNADSKPLSEEQRKLLTPILDRIETSIDELAAQLQHIGRLVRPAEEDGDDASCLVPAGARTRQTGRKVAVRTLNCRHRFTRHDF